MSISSYADPLPGGPSPVTGPPSVIIEDRILIPPQIDSLSAFRRWASSAEFPAQGAYSFLDTLVWIELSMEELFTHNQVKAAFAYSIMALAANAKLGRYVPDRMYLTNQAANLSTEPDGLYFLYQTVQSGLLKFVDKPDQGTVELEGAPDMTLEVVSKTSVRKDTVILRELYHKAGIPEYWLVDARSDVPSFSILLYHADGYQAAPTEGDWRFSPLFGTKFRLNKEIDPLGKPLFAVETSV